ncbi:RNA polymerase sigma-70 factor (ECF subfamily) [Pseudonocardia endophytica]|uniref:RNA polymerase sigma-70 factor (ECF subfamily) n=1 Tax=Pseudonocardia endophytica TaxID=401976 RepID=A0A4R1HU73_PSEEN|nr:RNA polymerase sigma-70 factor (ECF subfamily) [Pseudonocardia endophytica]
MSPQSERTEPGSLDAAADEWLIGKIRRGDSDAYEELVRRHRDRIYRIALRMIGNPHDADDIAQDVVLSLWTTLTGFSGNSRFTTWLYRVVVNRCINLIERRPEHEPLQNPDVPIAGADAEAEAKQAALAALAAIGALPPDQRAVVVLVDIEQMRYQEVASILNVTPATVRGRLHRARRHLLYSLRDWA